MRLSLAATALAVLLAPPLARAQDQGGGDKAPAKDPAAAKPAGPRKASIAVMKFSYVESVLKTEDSWVKHYLHEFDTNLLTSKFVTALVKTNKFDVVDRDKLEQVLKEQQFGETGQLDPARCVKAGKIMGADFFLTGSISYFVIGHSYLENPYNPGNFTYTLSATMVVDMRIVDTRTTKIVAADKGEARVATKFQTTSIQNVPVSARLLDDLQRQLCESLAVKTIDGVYPVKVVMWDDGTAYLNRGEGGGLHVGDLLDVFSLGKEIVDPDTGAVLGQEEKKVGQLRVTSVEAKLSKAVPATADSIHDIPKGSVCRKARPSPGEGKGPGNW